MASGVRKIGSRWGRGSRVSDTLQCTKGRGRRRAKAEESKGSGHLHRAGKLPGCHSKISANDSSSLEQRALHFLGKPSGFSKFLTFRWERETFLETREYPAACGTLASAGISRALILCGWTTETEANLRLQQDIGPKKQPVGAEEQGRRPDGSNARRRGRPPSAARHSP
jgi:hypothetical protein